MAQPPNLLPPPSLTELSAMFEFSLFVDFDGTLVEIAPTPDAIKVPDRLPNALTDLSERIQGRLALVSGRSLKDLGHHLSSEYPIARAGSHGAERRLANGSLLGNAPRSLPTQVISELEAFAAGNGLLYEAKTHGGALHYREMPQAGDAVKSFARAIAERNDLTVKLGKCVVELVHPGAEKGSAVCAFMDTPPFSGTTPIFIGDDVTDEDGFAACQKQDGFGILVGEPRETNARYRLASVTQVYQWLGL